MLEHESQAERTYHILGIPLRTGSFYPGNENDAQAYREVELVARLQAVGCHALDEGDVTIPSYLPHHMIPPIRNWPGPRIAWDCLNESIIPYLQHEGHVPLLIGCDCSIVVGTIQALMRVSSEELHILYLDGDFDDAAPEPERCLSAAAMAVWLLTHGSPFWAGPPLKPSQITVIGWTNPPLSEEMRTQGLSLADLRRSGCSEAARQILQAIPGSTQALLHCDIDVLRRQEMPAAYFPHMDGLTLSEGRELLSTLMADPRIRIIEVAEYAVLRDLDQRYVSKIVDLLVEGLRVK